MGRKRKDEHHCLLQNAYMIRKKCPSMGKDDIDRLARLAVESNGLKRAIEKFPEDFAPYKDALLAKDVKETYKQKIQRWRLERQKGIVSPEAAAFFRRINANSRKRYMEKINATGRHVRTTVDECDAIPPEETDAAHMEAFMFALEWLEKLEGSTVPAPIFIKAYCDYEPCLSCGKKDYGNNLRAGLCLECYAKVLDIALKERGAARDAEKLRLERRHENLLIVQ